MDSGHLKAGGPRPQTERRSARGATPGTALTVTPLARRPRRTEDGRAPGEGGQDAG